MTEATSCSASLISTASFKGSPLNCLRNCDSQINSLNAAIKKSRKEISSDELMLSTLKKDTIELRTLRESQQEEILRKNKEIAVSDTECLRIKNKLPFLSRPSILNNINKLEALLRMNNYKPKEEQLVLNQISKLKNSLPLLNEYNLKLGLNRGLRKEKANLVHRRDTNYNKLQNMYKREGHLVDKINRVMETLKKQISELEGVSTMRLALLKIAKEKLEQRQRRKEQTSSNSTAKEECRSESQQEQTKLFSPSKARPPLINRNVYGPEISACKCLLSYFDSLYQQYRPAAEAVVAKQEQEGVATTLINPGNFYSKPKVEVDSMQPKKKKNKKNRVKKNKDLTHPPEVFSNCFDLSIRIPKSPEELPDTLKSVREKINYYQLLNEQNIFNEQVYRMKLENAQRANAVSLSIDNMLESKEASAVTIIDSCDSETLQNLSDVESGVGDETEHSINLSSEKGTTYSPSCVPVECSCPGALPPIIVSDGDPSVSCDSTSSGCSSNILITSHSVSSVAQNSMNKSNSDQIMVSQLSDESNSFSKTKSLPNALPYNLGNDSSNVPPSVGPIVDGFCALPPTAITANKTTEAALNYAAVAARNVKA